MNNKILPIAAVLLFVLPTIGWAVDFAGNWIVQIPSSRGMTETVFSFNVDGTKLTGKVTTHEGDTPISEGKIDCDEISFVVKHQIDEKLIVQRYSGKLAGMVYGDEIKLTREIQSETGETEEFIAKREFPLGNYDPPISLQLHVD